MDDWMIVNYNTQRMKELVCVSIKGMEKRKESQFLELGTQATTTVQTMSI